MYLTHLSLTNFRAFARLDLDVPRQPVLLVGDNAQGKTSLLEAVYFMATYSSFLASSDRQLIHFGAIEDPQAVARLVATFMRAGSSRRLEIRLIQESNGANQPTRFRKELLLDGVKRPWNDVIGLFNAVIFLPQMSRILEGGPEDRRRYLNLTLSQAVPGYAQALSDYNQALQQRNALLKQLGERGGDPDQLLYWDNILADRGAALIHDRITALQELERHAARVHQRLTASREVLRLHYQPAYDPLPAVEMQYALPLSTSIDRSSFSRAQIQQGFLQRLNGLRSDEIMRGVTTCGPHRDELRFISNGIDLGEYGSRGQIRTTLLSLKLAEVAWLKERTGQWPVLLLDEVMAELDMQRRSDLLAALLEGEQALMTTTDIKLFTPDFIQNTRLWQVSSGVITPLG
ncbi:MAG TPA: DNA replication/repair protein RecF [Anaerolineaceae bacterium]|nr:DNA replication/repair protein RecF [Anaerolineaceae bacterium]HPN52326.1 DNA replication/repair protein RecF [Anaerolineaceae bacterium]